MYVFPINRALWAVHNEPHNYSHRKSVCFEQLSDEGGDLRRVWCRVADHSSALTTPKGTHCCVGFANACITGQHSYVASDDGTISKVASNDGLVTRSLDGIGRSVTQVLSTIYSTNDSHYVAPMSRREREIKTQFNSIHLMPVFYGQFRLHKTIRKIGERPPLGTPSKYLKRKSIQC